MSAMVGRRAVLALVLALLVAGCIGDTDTTGGNGTLVLGITEEAEWLDGAHTRSSGDFPVGSQIFEGLVTYDSDGDLRPSLARSWQTSLDGSSWTFELQRNVRFHDGTAFNAAAVCANFERWYNFRGILQSVAVSFAWRGIFGGFATQDDPTAPKESLYRSCEARADDEVVINLTRRSGRFLAAMAYWQFTLASPDALRLYEADKVTGTGQAPVFEGTFGTEHPIGTGPFKLERWIRNDRLVLVRNDDYWGGRPKLERVIYRPIPDPSARRQALESGEINGYYDVAPGDIVALERARFQVVRRMPVYFAFVAFNQAVPPFDNLKLRQAVAHALNREDVVKAKFPPGTEVGKAFLPPGVLGYTDDVTSYPYDPGRARRLIAESGVSNPTLEFWYPPQTSVGATLPDVEGIFQAFRADLEQVGFRVDATQGQQDYVRRVLSGAAHIYFVPGSADLDPDSFLNLLLGQTPPFLVGFNDSQVLALVREGDAEIDRAKREAIYRRVNKRTMELLPALPLAFSRPAVVLSKDVLGFSPHPSSDEERLTSVSLR